VHLGTLGPDRREVELGAGFCAPGMVYSPAQHEAGGAYGLGWIYTAGTYGLHRFVAANAPGTGTVTP
jgi:hypothetical protein